MKRNNIVIGLLTNVCLLSTSSVMVLSGLVIQIHYHMKHLEKNCLILGIDYFEWSDVHKISIVIVSILAIIHIILHWQWYKAVVQKKKYSKHHLVVQLTVVFLLVAITGYLPWLIDMADGSYTTRKTFIEIHDKLALFLFLHIIIHVAKARRLKWFINSLKRI